jgi:hypothetical protein
MSIRSLADFMGRTSGDAGADCHQHRRDPGGSRPPGFASTRSRGGKRGWVALVTAGSVFVIFVLVLPSAARTTPGNAKRRRTTQRGREGLPIANLVSAIRRVTEMERDCGMEGIVVRKS